ncbi:MAG: SurA N-terminal domain-containing protein [Elusimicrobiota bacterium]|jgi:parvulin-like peptidyl-prolyl isomerase|nr:SurA N-terminal domain-containing protein [Elusimicrobiota bacterium]
MKINKTTALLIATLFCANIAAAKVVDATMATVNGKAILNSQYVKLKEAVLEEYKKAAPQLLENKDNVTALEEETLNQMITEALLTQAAQEAKISVKDSELQEGINEIKARFALDPATGQPIADKKKIDKNFNDELKKEGITYKQFETRIKDQIAVRKLIDTVVRARAKAPTEEEVKKLYADLQTVMGGDKAKIEKIARADLEAAAPLAARLSQLTAEQVKISPVFIRADASMSEAVKKDKEKLAADIKKQIDGGKITFLEGIEKYSDDKSVLSTGGEAVLIRGVMPKTFDDKVFATEVGKTTGPIKTDDGFYVIRVNEKRAKRDVTLPMIQADLQQYLASVNMQKATLEYLTELKTKAEIKVMVKFEYQTPRAAAPAAPAEPAKAQAAK